jgi:hypothetical protein
MAVHGVPIVSSGPRHVSGTAGASLATIIRATPATAAAAPAARHQSDVAVLDRAGDRRDVIDPDPDIGVGDDERVVLRVPQQICEVADLEVRADRPIVDDQLQLDAGEFVDEPLHHPDRRIVVIADAEEDLKGRVFLATERGEVLVELPVIAAQRLEDRDGRRPPRWRRTPARIPRDAGERSHPIQGREEDRCEEDAIDHGNLIPMLSEPRA